MSTPFTTLKIVVAAPSPKASVITAAIANAGLRVSPRRAYVTSR
jgi:hypothetical protein